MDIPGGLQDSNSGGVVGASQIRGRRPSSTPHTEKDFYSQVTHPALRLLRGLGVTRIGIRLLEKKKRGDRKFCTEVAEKNGFR